jgi:hypothetical protein
MFNFTKFVRSTNLPGFELAFSFSKASNYVYGYVELDLGRAEPGKIDILFPFSSVFILNCAGVSAKCDFKVGLLSVVADL